MSKTLLKEKCDTKDRTKLGVGTEDGAVIATRIEVQKMIRDDIINRTTEEKDLLLQEASAELNKTRDNIRSLIESNRGGGKGVHGFIAEQLETGIGNANSIMNGKGIQFILLDDNGRDDLMMGSTPVQMKFVQKALSLDAVKEHMMKYPEAIEDGEIYMIPRDYFEKLQGLMSVPVEEAGKLRNTDYDLWKKLRKLYEGGLPSDRLCAAEIDYDGAQKDRYQHTIEDCRTTIQKKRDEDVRKVNEENAPAVSEALKAVAFGAGIEGALSAMCVIYDKHKDGIGIRNYGKDDSLDVLKALGKGAINGGLRSGFIYIMVNFTPVPAGIASAVYTITEKTIEVGVKAQKDDTAKEEAAKQVAAIVGEVVITTVFAMVGVKCCKKNRIVGSIIGTATAKALIFVGKKAYSFFRR